MEKAVLEMKVRKAILDAKNAQALEEGYAQANYSVSIQQPENESEPVFDDADPEPTVREPQFIVINPPVQDIATTPAERAVLEARDLDMSAFVNNSEAVPKLDGIEPNE